MFRALARIRVYTKDHSCPRACLPAGVRAYVRTCAYVIDITCMFLATLAFARDSRVYVRSSRTRVLLANACCAMVCVMVSSLRRALAAPGSSSNSGGGGDSGGGGSSNGSSNGSRSSRAAARAVVVVVVGGGEGEEEEER